MNWRFSVLLLSLPLLLNAQISPDSLLQKLEVSQDHKEKSAICIQLADHYIYKTPTLSLEYATKAGELVRKKDNQEPYATALNRMGNAYWSLGKLDSALFFQDKALRIAQSGQYQQLEARILGNLGNIYATGSQSYDALFYYKEALKKFNALGVGSRQFAMLNNIGKEYRDRGELDSATIYLERAKVMLRPEFAFMEPIFLFNLADLTLEKNELNKADSILNACQRSANKYGANRAIIRVDQMRAEILLRKGLNNRAYNFAQSAYSAALKTQVKDLISICALTMSKAEESLGSTRLAYQYLNEHLMIKDSLESTRIRNQLIVGKYAKEQQAIGRLEQKNDLLESRATFRRTLNIILTVLMVLIVLYAYSLYQRRVQAKVQNEKLSELNDFKTKLFAVVAHDLRAPVYNLDTLIALIEEELSPDHPFYPGLQNTKERVQTLKELLNNLFNWAKDDLEDNAVKSEHFVLLPLLDEVFNSIHTLYNKKDIQLVNEIAPTAMVCADNRLLTIIIRNLLTNAIKFSPQASRVFVTSQDKGPNIAISIRDEGVGMNKRQLSKLFTHDTVHTLGTAGEVGSGLGLVLCKDFAERMNGTIRVESEEGKGTTFTILLKKGQLSEKGSQLESPTVYHPVTS
ncbi:MAG: tetratricopeptide repeat-containing sensor histidine kinase [Cytophagales bacterium]|nr:tetratricopeptide repeat-containing sensor histidine kinase [Cytophagales bacterium]